MSKNASKNKRNKLATMIQPARAHYIYLECEVLNNVLPLQIRAVVVVMYDIVVWISSNIIITSVLCKNPSVIIVNFHDSVLHQKCNFMTLKILSFPDLVLRISYGSFLMRRLQGENKSVKDFNIQSFDSCWTYEE